MAQDVSGLPRVIDGDTIEIAGTRIRLYGLDAPESAQTCNVGSETWACGQAATEALTRMIDGQQTLCWKVENDRYGRMVAVCLTGEKYINAEMVTNGHAVAYTKYSKAFVPLEAIAREKRLGLWRGEFNYPWDWRATRSSLPQPRNHIQTAPPPVSTNECKIKGNISKSGRIYHVPGGALYDRTKIDEFRGERWFCTEEEALKAGWRRANR